MVPWQKQIPQSQFLCFGFQFFEDRGIGFPSLFALPELGLEDVVCGDTVLFDEFLDLLRIMI